MMINFYKILEWISTLCIIMGAIFGSYFETYNIHPYLFILGGSGWMIVSYHKKIWSILLINFILTFIWSTGLL